VEDLLPAPGQGAIAVQCRAGDAVTIALLASIDEPLLRAETEAERWYLRVLKAGCSAPIGALARTERDGRLWMKCRVSAPDGSRTVDVEGGGHDPRALAESLARRSLEAGAAGILASVARPGAPGAGGSQSALRGKRVVVTRSGEQAAGLCAELASRGAVPVFLPMIRIEPAGDPLRLKEALRDLTRFRWILFTSANAVDPFAGLAAGLPRGPRIGAVGPATADALSHQGFTVDCVPAEHTATALAEAVCRLEPQGIVGARILLPRAEGGREEAAALLRARGAVVDDIVVYRTVPAEISDGDVARLAPGVDAILFTSGSTVRAWCDHARSFATLADAARAAAIACIGPSTRETAVERGLAVAVTPSEHTTRGLVAALESHFTRTVRGTQ
jgi:uroporphyrinogen-III synthase